MNCRQALKQARKILEDSGTDDSSLEGEVLLRHVLGMDRAALFSSLDRELTPIQIENLMLLVERRRRGEPAAYITGHREFYGLDFKVDPRVLIPRPETELLVEKAISFYRQFNFLSVADIGTGCGCIAIALTVYLPEVNVYAVDISPEALEVAAENCAAHGVKHRITLLTGDLLEPLTAPVNMIIANLPYVKKADLAPGFEPELALNGGEEGLDKIQALCGQARGKLKPGGILLLEIGQGQANTVKTILHKIYPDAIVEVTKDLAGIERVLSMRLTS